MTPDEQALVAHRGIEIPAVMRGRPIDHRGFPVPWFVTRKDENGHWDFVSIEHARFREAVRTERCWVSGERLGKYRAFCIGPMCSINRTAGDPPVRRDIALWSVKVCPFMSRPLARRSDHFEGLAEPLEGISFRRNPGVTAVWVSKTSEYQRGRGFYIGDPTEVSWWREGRAATRAEVLHSIETGYPVLEELASQEGPGALRFLESARCKAEAYLPAA